MSYHLGQLPILQPTEGRSAALLRELAAQASSIVPASCRVIQELSQMQRWEAPPPNLQPGSALVFGVRLPPHVAKTTGESIAHRATDSARTNLLAQDWRFASTSGFIPHEQIAWLALDFPTAQSKALSERTINSIVQGAFAGAMRHYGIQQLPAVLIYLSPDRVPRGEPLAETREMRKQIWLVSALRSVLTWEEFRAAVAVGLFGRMNLSTNVRTRTPNTGYAALQAGALAAANGPALAVAAVQLAESAIPVAEAQDAEGAYARLRQAKQAVQTALEQIDTALRVGPEVQAKAIAALAAVPGFVRAAVAATKTKITEPDAIRRQYMECKIWEWANEDVLQLEASFRTQRDQAPALLTTLQANAEAARAALQHALQQIEEIAARVEDILGPWWGRPLGPLPVWAWGAIGVTSFLGGAAILRRSRRKRMKTNRRRQRTSRRAAAA